QFGPSRPVTREGLRLGPSPAPSAPHGGTPYSPRRNSSRPDGRPSPRAGRLVRSQTRAVRSSAAEARSLPSPEKATYLTGPLCPWSRSRTLPVATSYRAMVLSHSPAASVRPLGENATQLAPP